MSGLIKAFKAWLNKTVLSLNVQFHETVISVIQVLAGDITLLQTVWTNYFTAANTLSDTYKRARKYMQTPVLVDLDNIRDLLLRRIVGTIEALALYPLNEAERQAVTSLQYIVDIYRNSQNRDYESNTTLVTHFLNAASSSSLAQAIATLNLGPALTLLRTKNEEFQSLYIARLEEMEQHKVQGNTSDMRKAANAALATFCDDLSKMVDFNITAADKAKINEIAFKLNAIIDQYEKTYHRHAGITAPKNRPGGGNGGDGDGDDLQDPDITLPLPPGYE